jgi:hypothetical protein
MKCVIHSKALSNVTPNPNIVLRPTVRERGGLSAPQTKVPILKEFMNNYKQV